MKLLSVCLFFLTICVFSCAKNDDLSGVFEGEKISLYSGQTWNWAKLDANGNPLQAAIVFDDVALNSLPIGGGAPPFEASSNFNERADKLPFIHAALDWNPSGHDPLFIYGKPHFDFHFYMITQATRLAIPLYTTDSARFKNVPVSAYLPDNYFNSGGGVPQMGVHWIDATSPEVSRTNPQPFTQTFIYGTYNGMVTFYEPMITLDFIKATTSFERTIPQPSKYKVAGYYPTIMRIKRHDGITEIILDGFVGRQAS